MHNMIVCAFSKLGAQTLNSCVSLLQRQAEPRMCFNAYSHIRFRDTSRIYERTIQAIDTVKYTQMHPCGAHDESG